MLLGGGVADLPVRQRTLRATLAWSCDLLRADEHGLFQRLAVFAGDWTVEAAEAVCGGPDASGDAVVEHLSTLVESSLIHRGAGADGQLRFSMLSTVREYALEGLAASGELDAINGRLLEWSVNLVQPVADPPVPDRIVRQASPRVIEWVARNKAALLNFRNDGDTWTQPEVNEFIQRLQRV